MRIGYFHDFQDRALGISAAGHALAFVSTHFFRLKTVPKGGPSLNRALGLPKELYWVSRVFVRQESERKVSFSDRFVIKAKNRSSKISHKPERNCHACAVYCGKIAGANQDVNQLWVANRGLWPCDAVEMAQAAALYGRS